MSESSTLQAMLVSRQWLLGKLEAQPNGKTAKRPFYVDGTPRRGTLDSAEDLARLATHADAAAAMTRVGAQVLGFALNQGWQGVDFDDVPARPELGARTGGMPGYVERSPSGRGLHAIGFGAPFLPLTSNASGIEAYSSGRFFTFTLDLVRDAPLVDLSPYIERELIPLHAAGRKVREVLAAPRQRTGDVNVDELADALRYLNADDRATWIAVGQACATLGEIGRQIWFWWSGTSSKFPGGDALEETWPTLRGSRTGVGAIFKRSMLAGWPNPRRIDPATVFTASAAIESSDSIPVPTRAIATALDTHLTMATAAGRASVPANVDMVVQALRRRDLVGVGLRFDRFLDELIIDDGVTARPVRDVDLVALRARLDRLLFRPVGRELIRDAALMVGEEAAFDSAIEWASGLRWDGQARVDTFFERYFGAAGTTYSRAVSAFAWTALAARVLVPGAKVDIAPILHGPQGIRKSTGVAAMAPTPERFAEIGLHDLGDDTGRKLRGILVAELGELRGRGVRDREAQKAWLARTSDIWVPKYRETAVTVPRRCLLVGTTNEKEMLDDPTGHRRFAPLDVHRVDVEGIVRDRAQLWAEGVAMFRKSGIGHVEVERLARHQHAEHEVRDAWEEPIARWLAEPNVTAFGVHSKVPRSAEAFALADVLAGALKLDPGRQSMQEQKRAGAILRRLGFEVGTVRSGDDTLRRWRRRS